MHVKSWACEGIRKWGFEGSLRFNFSKTKSGCNIKIYKIQPPNEGKHQGKNQIFGLEKEIREYPSRNLLGFGLPRKTYQNPKFEPNIGYWRQRINKIKIVIPL